MKFVCGLLFWLLLLLLVTPCFAEEAEVQVDYVARKIEALEILVYDQKNDPAWLQLANDYYDTGEQEKAIKAYTKYLALRPNSCQALSDRGATYRNTGKTQEAIKDFKKCLTINQHFVPALYNLAVIYSDDLHQPKQAMNYLSKLKEFDPTNPYVLQLEKAISQKQ